MSLHAGLLRLQTEGGGELVDITRGVQTVVDRAGVAGGVAVVFVVGSTAAVTTIEYEPGVEQDLRTLLDRLIPADGAYDHNALNGDTNAHAHLRASIIGPSETIPIADGTLGLGVWQQVVLADFDDRPRERVVSVHVLS